MRGRCTAHRRLCYRKQSHISRPPCLASADHAWCLCLQPAQGELRALPGFNERAEWRQGASGHGSGRQICARSQRRHEAMSEIDHAHALHTVTVSCKCIDFVCVRAVYHASPWIELFSITLTDHLHHYSTSEARTAICGNHGAARSYRTRDFASFKTSSNNLNAELAAQS